MAATEFFFSENEGLGSRGGGVMGCWRPKLEEGGGGLIKECGGDITFGLSLEKTGSVVVELKNSFSG